MERILICDVSFVIKYGGGADFEPQKITVSGLICKGIEDAEVFARAMLQKENDWVLTEINSRTVYK